MNQGISNSWVPTTPLFSRNKGLAAMNAAMLVIIGVAVLRFPQLLGTENDSLRYFMGWVVIYVGINLVIRFRYTLIATLLVSLIGWLFIW